MTFVYILDPNNRPEIITWLLDGNFNDVYGHYNGYLVDTNTATWIVPGYNGYGQAVYFNSRNYTLVDHYLNLTSTSFTISAWIWIPSSVVLGFFDYFIIFSHCESPFFDHCLHVGTVNDFLFFGFYSDDLSGNTRLIYNQWYHVAYVYDRSISKQFVYLNGRQDGIRTPYGSYVGNGNNLVIGTAPQMSILTTTFRTGYIDQLIFVSRRKNSSELLDEATLVAYYPFDGIYTDVGSNRMNNLSWINTIFDSNGRINQALVIGITNSSYFQTKGFYYLCQMNYSYSFSMWIYPLENVGIILQVNFLTSCPLPMIGFNNATRLTVQTRGMNGIYATSFTDGTIPIQIWTHITMTYSTSNGIQLFINGSLANSNKISTDYLGNNGLCTIILGNDPLLNSCITNPTAIVPGQFRGKIDEWKIFSRELSSMEIIQLASISN